MSLRFHQRWKLTLIQVGAQLLIALVTVPAWLTLAIAVLLIGGCVALDLHLSPERLLDLERRHWLENLPRTPDGGALVTRSDLKKYYPPTSTEGGSS